MASKYDVVIVGSGPAGIFAALELTQTSDLSILLLEKGKDLHLRKCPIIGRDISCPPCNPCGLVSGWGGAGAFSDGKLTLSPQVGGQIDSFLGFEKTADLIRHVDEVYQRFGAPDEVYGTGPEVERLGQRAEAAGLHLVPVPIRHMGTELSRDVLKEMHDYLSGKIESRTDTTATSIVVHNGQVYGIQADDGEKIEASYVVIAPGREGADWLLKESDRLGLTLHYNPVDIGVRVEVSSPVLEELTDLCYELKLEFLAPSYRDRVRTFCMCPAGEVTMETTGGDDPVITVNGHSYSHRKTANTNFALLVSAKFTPPFREPIAYGRYIARLANIVSGGVIMQRWGDFSAGRRSTPASIEDGAVEPTLKSATPGDLGYVLPYRFLKDISEMLTAMDRLAPGIASPHTLLYGAEVKFYSSRLELTENLETETRNLFAIGDGAGVTRGLIQAAASGVVAAREILRRVN
ncbi:MAG: FAD-dependent oxidoreductase [Dehalococcoidia bacterium]|nr:MAG: FAD-dependent oxidoreductase [Dehalococcoidia bacterium]